MELKDKKVTVFGLARSGVGAANLLAKMGAMVTVTDMKTEAELSGQLKRLDRSVRRVLGGHPDEAFLQADMLVLSPGVPHDSGPVSRAKARGVPVIGELELAYSIATGSRLRAGRGKAAPPPFLAVTGSNGKSTTTTLLDHMLRRGGAGTVLGGNIGNALTEEIYEAATDKDAALPDFFVVEVSSFQLETIDAFRPHIAAILNITPDHMDRYPSLAEYSAAKARVFENQRGDDFLVLNADDPEVLKVRDGKLGTRSVTPNIVYFSRTGKVAGVYVRDGVVHADFQGLPSFGPGFPLINAEEIRIKGVHNLENAMAASAMALLAGCPPWAVIDSLRDFSGLEHRLEFVREFNGVRYINDSKGTNVGAVIKSVESFREPLILIAGGRDKAGDFSILRGPVSSKVKALVLIGEAAGKIRDALGDVTDTVTAGDLAEAVAIARRKAEKGDVVLLSPACASFDMFRDFEDRGRQFKKIVMELKGQ